MKNSARCIKAVPYQEIIDLRDTFERLHSWQEPLTVFLQIQIHRLIKNWLLSTIMLVQKFSKPLIQNLKHSI